MDKVGNRKKAGVASKLGLTMLVLGLLGTVAGIGTWSAFSATTENAGNSFTAGSVSISDDSTGTMFVSLTGLTPLDTFSRCVKVTYGGNIDASVRLYGTTGGTGLDTYLSLKVTRGMTTSASSDCATAGFSADGTDYNGNGAGVIYDGTLEGFADNYGAGLVDPKPAAMETWIGGESHAYKFAITVQDNSAAQGKTATQTFTFDAQNT